MARSSVCGALPADPAASLSPQRRSLCLQVIQFALRDYIQYWYYTLSEDESFLLEIRQTLQNALVQFCTRYGTRARPLCSVPNSFLILFCNLWGERSKEVDWQPYFTTRLVDDFATHLRVFRKAQDRLADREDKQSKPTMTSDLR